MGLFTNKVQKELTGYLRKNSFMFDSMDGKQNKNKLSRYWGRYDESNYKRIVVVFDKGVTISIQIGKTGSIDRESFSFDMGAEKIEAKFEELAPFLTSLSD